MEIRDKLAISPELIAHLMEWSYKATTFYWTMEELLHDYRMARIGERTTNILGSTRNILGTKDNMDNSISKSACCLSRFGMLIWEITSHEIPFPDKTIDEVYTMLKDSDTLPPPIIFGTQESIVKDSNVGMSYWRFGIHGCCAQEMLASATESRKAFAETGDDTNVEDRV
ncbi:3391_t:CDS:2 [Paraglomus occultum]|uniref:3391_t:CDS:1 n=1 Tax=Paraglomus occultum TaxID=144539 RepID=A0A9N8ZCY6_9GLOM|nr:3391_t:CDS:2 [Paraglomus occultum]